MSYYGRPILKPPPWTWEVPLYLFVGGLAGASAVLALAGKLGEADLVLVPTALWIAVLGAAASALLLISDLGRPRRFLNMLRVFKWRSPMSVGAWLLTAFGGSATLALLVERARFADAPQSGMMERVSTLEMALSWTTLASAAVLGALVATYTGVLLSVTVVPAWRTHARLLPLHFGVAALGSAAAVLELLLLRVRPDALHSIGLLAAVTETALALWIELRREGAADRALRTGTSGWVVRSSGALIGPVSLALRLGGLRGGAAVTFLLGALLGRFAWIAAGRASARDPAAAS
jgi:formate-dependent nitrite reductase membrane component NrfD